MSRFSGKYDLADELFMTATHVNKDNPNIIESDELESFIKFKEQTKGVIYQSFLLELNKYNIDREIKRNPLLKKIEKNKKTIYEYIGTEYKSLKSLNKNGYLAKREIHFDNFIDIIPYLSYIVSISIYDEGKRYICITNESLPDIFEKNCRKFGSEYDDIHNYRKTLQKYYYEIIQKYGDKVLDE